MTHRIYNYLDWLGKFGLIETKVLLFRHFFERTGTHMPSNYAYYFWLQKVGLYETLDFVIPIYKADELV